jgi:hypothetical protein
MEFGLAVYKDNPHTLLGMKEATANFIWKIPPVELLHVFENKLTYVDACLQACGVISNVCGNLSKYEKCICINVLGLSP